MGDLAIRRSDRVDGEAVVLRGDGDLAGGQVLHRLVAAAVAELELVSVLPAERAARGAGGRGRCRRSVSCRSAPVTASWT